MSYIPDSDAVPNKLDLVLVALEEQKELQTRLLRLQEVVFEDSLSSQQLNGEE